MRINTRLTKVDDKEKSFETGEKWNICEEKMRIDDDVVIRLILWQKLAMKKSPRKWRKWHTGVLLKLDFAVVLIVYTVFILWLNLDNVVFWLYTLRRNKQNESIFVI